MGYVGADHADEPVAIDERVARPAPECRLRRIVLLEIPRPDDLSSCRLEAEEVTLGAERIDAVAVDRGCAPWAGGIGDRVGDGVFMLPENLSRGLVEAEHPLPSRGRLPLEVGHLHVGVGHIVGHEHAAARDGGAGVTAGNRRPPEHLRPPLGKPLRDAAFAPHVVAAGPHPLGPVVAAGDGEEGREDDQRNGEEVAHA